VVRDRSSEDLLKFYLKPKWLPGNEAEKMVVFWLEFEKN
jgi:hypothetical protein